MLKVAQGDLTVRVPAENVDLVGVRDVVDSAGLDRVFSVLRQPYTEEPTNWSRRYKANLEKLGRIPPTLKSKEQCISFHSNKHQRGTFLNEAHTRIVRNTLIY